MKCPDCGASTYVLEGRQSDQPWRRRRRICGGCHLRFSTVEVLLVDGYPQVPERLIHAKPVSKDQPLPKAITNRRETLGKVRETRTGRCRRTCRSCLHWAGDLCLKDRPNPGGLTAVACSDYEKGPIQPRTPRKAPEPVALCRDCELWSRHGCSLGLSDHPLTKASACNHYESIHDANEHAA